jgi:Seryl-tRNA synthetase
LFHYTDYSVRRMSSRYSLLGGTGLLHTLKGTFCANTRTPEGQTEKGQQSEGPIAIPDALQSYVGFDSVPGAAK